MKKFFFLTIWILIVQFFIGCFGTQPEPPHYSEPPHYCYAINNLGQCVSDTMGRGLFESPTNPDFSGRLAAKREVCCNSVKKEEFDACVLEAEKDIDSFNSERRDKIINEAVLLGLLGEHELVEFDAIKESYSKLDGKFTAKGSLFRIIAKGNLHGESGQKKYLLFMWKRKGAVIISSVDINQLAIVPNDKIAKPTIRFKYDIGMLEEYIVEWKTWPGNPNDLIDNVVTGATLTISEKQLKNRVYFRLIGE